MSALGNNIKTYRKKSGLTQAQLAQKCGLATGTIQQYELGKREPRIEIIDKIASVLGVQIIDLMACYTLQEYRKTAEFQKNEIHVDSIEGVISILRELYGKVEDKEVSGDYASGFYYLCGDSNTPFILYEHDIDTLYNAIKALLPPLIDRIKDNRPENEVIEEIKKDCSDPESLKSLLSKADTPEWLREDIKNMLSNNKQ